MTWTYTAVARDRDGAVASLHSYRPDLRPLYVYPVHPSCWIEGQPLGAWLAALVCPSRRWWRVVCRDAPAAPTLVPA